MHRRVYLGRMFLVGGIASLAGCAQLFGPDPTIESVDGDQSLSDSFTGSMEVEFIVENNGRSGEVDITISFEDDDGTVVGRETHEITMDSDERRRDTVSVDVPADASVYTVEADAA